MGQRRQELINCQETALQTDTEPVRMRETSVCGKKCKRNEKIESDQEVNNLTNHSRNSSAIYSDFRRNMEAFFFYVGLITRKKYIRYVITVNDHQDSQKNHH